MLFLSYAVCVERLLSFGQQILRFIQAKGHSYPSRIGLSIPKKHLDLLLKRYRCFKRKIRTFRLKDTYLFVERLLPFKEVQPV